MATAGNIAAQGTHYAFTIGMNDGRTLLAQIDQSDAHRLRMLAPGDPVIVEPTDRDTSPFYLIVDAATCRYYRRRWDEDSGDLCRGWGGSNFWFEVHADGYVSRQIQQFDNGRLIMYDEVVPEDDYGGRSTIPLDHDEYGPFTIRKDEFFDRWDPDLAANRLPSHRG